MGAWRLTYIEQASGDEPPCVFCDKLERDDREALILHRGETAFCCSTSTRTPTDI